MSLWRPLQPTDPPQAITQQSFYIVVVNSFIMSLHLSLSLFLRASSFIQTTLSYLYRNNNDKNIAIKMHLSIQLLELLELSSLLFLFLVLIGLGIYYLLNSLKSNRKNISKRESTIFNTIGYIVASKQEQLYTSSERERERKRDSSLINRYNIFHPPLGMQWSYHLSKLKQIMLTAVQVTTRNMNLFSLSSSSIQLLLHKYIKQKLLLLITRLPKTSLNRVPSSELTTFELSFYFRS